MLKKTYIYVITLVLGAVLAALGFLLTDIAAKALCGVLIGVGAGLFGMSVANLIMKRYEKKNPSVARQSQIEMSDERSVMIRVKARAASANIVQWFIIGLAYVMILIDAPLWGTLCAVGVYMLYHILSFVFMNRYQKQM